MENPYETGRLVADYLAFHYPATQKLPVPQGAADFASLVVNDLLPGDGHFRRALDLGCAVGRSAFELSRRADAVLGIDFSNAFIATANEMKSVGRIACRVPVEGERTELFEAIVPPGLNPSRVVFETGDACDLRPDLGMFDLVLAANLLCRLPEPRKLLLRLPQLIRPGGFLLLATPFSWLPEFTPREHWIGGREGDAPSFDILKEILAPDFELELTRDLPFLIREHARKFQLGFSLGSRWRRR